MVKADPSPNAAAIARRAFRKAFFAASGHLTEAFPRAGARFLDSVCAPVIANPALAAYGRARLRRALRGVRAFDRFLVVPDIHIGDAVMAQAAVSALRDFFPEARIDYLVNRAAYPLIAGNPEPTRIVSLFSGGDFIGSDDLLRLRRLVRAGRYDAVWSFGPFIRDEELAVGGSAVFSFMNRSPDILRTEKDPTRVNHFIRHTRDFVRDLLALRVRPRRSGPFRGVRLILPAAAGLAAVRFLSEAGIDRERPLILFNPDGSSRFSRMPYSLQALLLRRLAGLDATLLMNAGHTLAGIGERLKATLPAEARRRVAVLPPDLPIDVYAAIVDLCGVFISGDSGPLHVAAARRDARDGGYAFRNRTAVLACFGATPARMSGYDSARPGYLAANQDAPSWSISAASPCRNLTCLNKMEKTCPRVRCFDGFDLDGLVGRVSSRLAGGPA